MKRNTKELVQMENLVRAGDFPAVKEMIREINVKKIPREQLARYANIANRVDQPRFAYRVLHPIVRSEKRGIEATEAEKIEYAEVLRLMGLTREAMTILSGIDAVQHPIVHLRNAFCLIVQWNYAGAIPHLQEFIKRLDAKDYLQTVARINLAASYVNERRDAEALALLEELKGESKQQGHRLLHGNSLELMAQLFIHQGDFQRANATIDEAVKLLGDSSSRFSLYIQKWAAISRGLETKAVHSDLLICRQTASQTKDWETVRDCDLYIGYLRGDQDLIRHVYFGTPFSTYRKRIKGLVGFQVELPESYLWNPLREREVDDEFDLVEGRSKNSDVAIETGHLMHRVLFLLCADFYRPLSVSTAFSELFPQENFSQTGSANRVVQVVKRLREWSEGSGQPFLIEEKDGGYRLRLRAGVGIRVPSHRPDLSLLSIAWERVAHGFRSDLFSKQEIIRRLDCSKASAERLLRWAVDGGHADVVGGGPNRRYRIAG